MLKSGQVIMESGKIPENDIFSYTASSPHIPWLNHEWLAGIVFFLLYSIGKFSVLLAFKSAVILASYSLMIYLAWRRTGHNLTAAVLAGIIMILISGGNLYFDIRAYLFTYILLAATLLVLDTAYYKEKPLWLYGLIPITLIWVNTHGGYILVYILQIMFLLCAIAERMRKGLGGVALKAMFFGGTGLVLFLKRTADNSLQVTYYVLGFLFVVASILVVIIDLKSKKEIAKNKDEIPENESGNQLKPNSIKPNPGLIKHGLISLGISIVCGLMNPYTYEIFLYPFTFLGDSFYKRNLIEWIPPDLMGNNLPLLIVALLVLIGSVIFSRKLRTTDFLLISMFSYLSLTTVRHSVLYSIALVPVMAVICYETGIYIGKFIPKISPIMKQACKIIVLALFVFMIILSSFIFIIPGRKRIDYARLNMERDLFPSAGVEFLKLNDIPGRMYNPYEWGGYFIWKIYPKYRVFIDGRANTVYSEQIYRESLSTMRGDPGWENVMDKYNINFIFCNKLLRDINAHYLPDKLEKSSKWILIFEDQIEKVFIRNTPENSWVIEKARNRKLNYPVTPYSLNRKAFEYIREQKWGEASGCLQKAVEIEPGYIPALANLGYVNAVLGKKAEALKIFEQILMLNPNYPGAHFNLGKLYESEGEVELAIRHYRAELKSNPGFEPAKKSLNILQKGNKR
ncbi:MAG: hypothetical protein K8T10_14475 [Candidatus Eremiobacteraeota bacterium]|nr:hypothetical protein [Candidatus Eremiobacteraeota bacterium]